ncbi:MAG: WD40 repeat domain-containing serine/threonine-protein kinase [Terriglobales bacterium]|jgi:serine/threonine protein kinase
MGESGDDRRTVDGGMPSEFSSGDGATLPLSPSQLENVSRESIPDSPTIPAEEVLAGRYQVIRVLGRGGMGEVYEAEDLELRTKVALKIIRPELAAQPGVLERFKREIQLARKVTHANVCRIFDLGYHVDSSGRRLSFLTMELLHGETLADRIGRAGRLTTTEALPIVEQMAAGLQAAHAEGIVHRDFKGANVMLIDSPPGSQPGVRAKITDFGLARAVAGTEARFSTLTGSAALAGTPAYMAPEQVEGLEITAQSDIYALGVVMYEMVTGVLPFSGPTPWSVAVKRLTEVPLLPRIRVPNLDPKWERAILGCLERKPADRFANASEIIATLEDGRKPQRKVSNSERSRRLPFLITSIAGLVLLASLSILYLHYHRTARATEAPAASPTERQGWRQSLLPAEVRFSDISLAAKSLGEKQISFFGPSMLRTWQPGSTDSPSQQTGLVVAERADCSKGMWLIQDDHRHLTNWDTEQHKPLKTIMLPWAFASAGCLDEKQERWLFLASDDRSSRLIEFDVSASRSLRELKLPEKRLKMSIDPSREQLVLVGTSTVSEWSVADFRELFKDELTEDLLSDVAAGWSGSGRYFATGRRQLVIYDMREKKRINALPMAGRSVLGWLSDDGLSAMDDRGRLFWTANLHQKWQLYQEPPQKGLYNRVFWLPEEWRWIAIDESGKGFTWQYETPTLFDLPVSATEIWSIAASPGGTTVAVSSKETAIRIVDLQQQKVVRTLEGHTDGVPLVRFDALGRLISVSDDGTIRLWDPASGNLLNTIDAHRNLINYFALSPDGQWLVSVSSDKKIKVFQMPAMTFVAEAGNTRNSGASVAFLPGDNHRFLVGDWSGWLYLFEGDGPNWKLAQDFRIADREIYTVCSAHNAWWASVFRGDQSGLWKVPGLDLKSAVRVQQVPSYYCTTTNDGQLSAIVFPQGVQLRSNLDGRAWPAVQFAMAAGSPVAIQTQQHMLVVGLENGHVVAWPLPPLTPTSGER